MGPNKGTRGRMSILTIDTSTSVGSLSIWLSSEQTVDWIGDRALTHGERLPGDIANVLERGNIRLEDIEMFGVGIGPGSFTGLRVGIATVQGLAVAQGRKVVPVPTLDAVVAARMMEKVMTLSASSKACVSGETTCTVAWMDGQRGHVFAGFYTAEPRALGVVRPRCIDGPRVGYPADVLDALIKTLASYDACVSLEVVGSAVERDKELLLSRLAAVTEALYIASGESVLAPVMGRLVAAGQYEAVTPEKLQPLYVRAPDAVLARDRRVNRDE